MVFRTDNEPFKVIATPNAELLMLKINFFKLSLLILFAVLHEEVRQVDR